MSKGSRSWLHFVIAGGAVLSAVFGLTIYFQKEDINPETGCPISGPLSTTVVVIDTSDPLSLQQQSSFGVFLETLITPPRLEEIVTANSDSANYVAQGHLLIGYEIMRQENSIPNLLFVRCNPGNPQTRSFADRFSEGTTLAQLKWYEFVETLASAFPKALLDQTADISPIIETLKYIRGTHFPSPAELKSSGHQAGSIFIVSDLLQNSSELSHFSDLEPAAEIPSYFALDLTGIDIGIRYLKSVRHPHLQDNARHHFRWWREFFSAAGAPLRKPPDVW